MKNSSTRKTVLDLLQRMEKGAYSSIALDNSLNRRHSGGKSSCYSDRDKAFISALFYGVLERQLTLDYIIGEFVSSKPDKLVQILLRMALYQLIFMDSVPESAAVNESVELTPKRAKGYVNAVLRNFLRSKRDFIIENEENLSIKFSCPDWLIEKWREEYGEEAMMQILETSLLKPPTFERDGYIQDKSSQQACELLNPQPGEIIIDLCAAPGGKSFTIAQLMNNTGRIMSCDINRKKLKVVEKRAEQLGLDIIGVCVNDAKVFNPYLLMASDPGEADVSPEALGSKADKVVCDVPCSGLGVIRRKPEIKYKPQSEFEGLPEIQLQILLISAKYVKDNGVLMYSTCTLSRVENDDVIEKFLRDNSEFELIEKRTTIPSEDGGDGFFVAFLRKT